MRQIELLAPAKDLECGKAAIDHGADAVYIGASDFGARVAAGNSTDDISALCQYAHGFGAKVYVTVNTIVYDGELEDVRRLIMQLTAVGVDAILVQDMGVLKLLGNYAGPVPELHASTQTDNRNAAKVEWLHNLGFSRVVLARELSLGEIAEIHKVVPDVELEVFVHGALCVSYSGACYASACCFGRSANRGECAQFCRLAFDLRDAEGKTIDRDRYFLSLKDLCQIDEIERIVDAGATSLKIEGRLKNIDYVKNVVSAYSMRLDEIVGRHPDKYRRSSFGKVEYMFTPHLEKTFNRGFTNYFLNGRTDDIASLDTPKAMGEYVGYVKEIKGKSFNVAGTTMFANGDGLCFVNKEHKLEGFRVNRVESNRLYPLAMPEKLRAGMALYRNNDQAFEKILSRQTAIRRLAVDFSVRCSDRELTISAVDEMGRKCTMAVEGKFEKALKPQRDNIVRQIEKLGNTIYKAGNVAFEGESEKLFIPSSMLSELRRKVVENLMAQPVQSGVVARNATSAERFNLHRAGEKITAKAINAANVANRLARELYEEQNVGGVPYAYELGCAEGKGNRSAFPIMTCRHCLRNTLGFCSKKGKKLPWKEPLFLALPDGRKFRLSFNCSRCEMNVYAEN